MDLSENNDIRHKYRLSDEEKEDPATKEWCKLIDLDTVIESELDWHSTRTFELFLDALDVNQFVIKDVKKTNPHTGNGQINKAINDKNSSEDKVVTNSTKQNGSVDKTIAFHSGAIKNRVDTYQGVETILSAEALKILSELPDLSHMSSTRSFIFPNHNKVRR